MPRKVKDMLKLIKKDGWFQVNQTGSATWAIDNLRIREKY